MNILHIGRDSMARICGKEGYYASFKENFPLHCHRFFIVGEDVENYFKNATDIIFSNLQDIVLENLIQWSDMIIIHGLLADKAHLERLKKYQDDGKRTVWLIWGHDLYDEYWSAHELKRLRRSNAKHMWHAWKNEKVRKKVIYNMSYIVGEKGDVDKAFEWYKTNAQKIYYNFIIGYGTPRPIDLPENSNNGIIKILIGNHADAHCRYLETIEILHLIDDGKMEIHLMMNGYSSEIPYVKKTLDKCQKYFSKRFFPIFDWMSYEELSRYINNMDVGIFNIDRQMGQGTSLIFIYYGKKVFFSAENFNYENYSSKGIKVFGMDELNGKELNTAMSDKEKKTNKEIIQNIMNSNYFYITWKKVFEKTDYEIKYRENENERSIK